MGLLNTVAEFYLISIALSLTLFSIIARSELTGNGFIKLITNVSLGALVLAVVVNKLSGGHFASISMGLKYPSLVCLLLVTLFHKDYKTLEMWILWMMTIIFTSFDIFFLSNLNWLHFLYLYSSALFLGIITYAMILGHWYLVVPKLSAHPLKIAAIITWILLGAKFLFSLYTTYMNADFFSFENAENGSYAFNIILVSMRFIFGYVVIFIMSLFNWKLLQLRSIQSSTGVLYAMTFFIFIGELISMYFYYKNGLML